MDGFDRVADGKDNWFHGPRLLPPTIEELAASLWPDMEELKDAILMAEGDRVSPRAKSFIKEIGQGTVNSTNKIGQFTANMTDEEFAILKRLVEKRSREAAQVTVTPVSTAQHCIPRSLIPGIPSDVYDNMEEKDKGWMNLELTKLESSSAGTGLETPGQQCPRTREQGRKDKPSPTAICSLAWDQTKGETSLHQRNTLVREPGQLQHQQNSGTRQLAKKTSSLTPWERGEGNALERGCSFVFLFHGGSFGPWEARCF